MKIRLGELRRLIREALGGEELALYEWYPKAGFIKVALYSPAELLALDWNDRQELPKDILKGYAAFHKPDEPCNDAWEVTSIAGIGYGKLLYGLGYSLVPSGRLMPDRMYSSKRAKGAWGKQVGKLNGLPLDDIHAPKDKQLTPDDPSDDCFLQVPMKKGGPDPVLDVAYEGGGVNPEPMRATHYRTLEKLAKILNDLDGGRRSAEEVEDVLGGMLKSVSTGFFTSEFEKYYKER
jgi:hypothetical protein